MNLYKKMISILSKKMTEKVNEKVNEEIRKSILRNKHNELAEKFDIEKVNNLSLDLIEYEIKPYLELKDIKVECRVKYWLDESSDLVNRMNKITYSNIMNLCKNYYYVTGKNKKEKIEKIIERIKGNSKHPYIQYGGI